MSTIDQMFCRRKMDYDELHLEQGEVFTPLGRPNDAVLISVNYVARVKDYYPHGLEAVKCVRCGKDFVDETYKSMHDTSCATQELNIDETSKKLEEMLNTGGRVVDKAEIDQWQPASA